MVVYIPQGSFSVALHRGFPLPILLIRMNAPSRQHHSFRLFARPTFLEGVARVFDFANVLQNYRHDTTEHEADTNALRSDWIAVGDDLRHAISTYERQPRA
jgi:hypothetical protein